ncbi:amidohydrolase [Hyphomonas oceanitis SCH89]|uniref:Amidohydrolase n=1 Tax=Hyphomonas oceanitis SCH89 TaxID=1280953 RepID=A0A059G3X2_9PROT|nr:amidohydrolase [Hyphomonas oceanitis SCH89]
MVTLDDRIVFTGDMSDALQWAKTKNVPLTDYDLAGAAALPGFIDGHLHPLPMIFFAMNANFEGAKDMDEIRERLLLHVKDVEPDEWIIGVQYEGKKMPDGQTLTRRALDEICPDRPVLIYARDGHCVIVNSCVLQQAGIHDQTQDPEGGSIGRYDDGTLNGLFHEKAAGLPLQHMPRPSRNRMLKASVVAFESLAKNGITSIGTMLQSDEEGPGGAASQRESLFFPNIRHLIPQSVYSIIIGKTLDGINALVGSSVDTEEGKTQPRAFKIFADGTFGSCTACMSEPYADKTCTHGYMTLSDDEIYSRMTAAHLAGYQICIHAVGDQGIANCVDLFERLLEEYPRHDHRHRIEHASIASKPLIRRIARLGLGICTQPLFIRSEKDWLGKRLGAERSGMAYPFRDYLDAGITLGGSSDAPIEDTDVIAALDYAVNRGGYHPEQGITPMEAVSMFTRNAAFLQFEEAEKGALEVGKRADIVVLSHNPLDVAPQDIGKLKVLRTMIGGAFVESAAA